MGLNWNWLYVYVYLLGNVESRVNWKWTPTISRRVCLRVIDDDSCNSSVVSNYDWVLPDFDRNLRKLKTEIGLSQNSDLCVSEKAALRLQFFALGILQLRYFEIAKIDFFVLTNQHFQLTRFHVWKSISIRFIFFSFNSEKSFKLKIGIKIIHDWNWYTPLLLLMYELEDFENFLLNSVL